MTEIWVGLVHAKPIPGGELDDVAGAYVRVAARVSARSELEALCRDSLAEIGLEFVSLEEADVIERMTTPPELVELVRLAAEAPEGDLAYGTIHEYESEEDEDVEGGARGIPEAEHGHDGRQFL